jgi:hypothetical protein
MDASLNTGSLLSLYIHVRPIQMMTPCMVQQLWAVLGILPCLLEILRLCILTSPRKSIIHRHAKMWCSFTISSFHQLTWSVHILSCMMCIVGVDPTWPSFFVLGSSSWHEHLFLQHQFRHLFHPPPQCSPRCHQERLIGECCLQIRQLAAPLQVIARDGNITWNVHRFAAVYMDYVWQSRVNSV